MTNFEKYKDKIYSHNGDYFCRDFIRPIILEADECNGICIRCNLIQAMWLMEEYKEPKKPETDWSKVKVDTPILVRVNEDVEWLKRYFAKYENGKVYAWDFGRTSWNETIMIEWDYAKLAESEKDK